MLIAKQSEVAHVALSPLAKVHSCCAHNAKSGAATAAAQNDLWTSIWRVTESLESQPS